MSFCIDREKSPATCCCGCSLTCGVITVGVLYGLDLVGNIFALNVWGILASLFFLVPIAAMAIWKESKGLRFFNYLLQAIILGASIIALIVLVICIDGYDLPEFFCSYNNIIDSNDIGQQSCMKAVRLYLYGAWAAACVLWLPLQFLFMSIFKAYHDELKEDGQGYSQLPNEDNTA